MNVQTTHPPVVVGCGGVGAGGQQAEGHLTHIAQSTVQRDRPRSASPKISIGEISIAEIRIAEDQHRRESQWRGLPKMGGIAGNHMRGDRRKARPTPPPPYETQARLPMTWRGIASLGQSIKMRTHVCVALLARGLQRGVATAAPTHLGPYTHISTHM